jgi:hypothetical protein
MTKKHILQTDFEPEETIEHIRKMLLKHKSLLSHNLEEADRNAKIEFLIGKEDYEQYRVRFVVTMPTMAECYLRRDGGRMGDVQAKQSYEKQVRSAWRSLYLVIKGKLESIEMGIETIEEVFMAQLVLSDGKTLAEVVLPQLESGQLMLSGGTS